MTANSQSKTAHVAPHVRLHRQGPHSRSSKSYIQQMILLLVIVGSVLFLEVQPVAAAPTITEFHVSNAGVPQGITAGPDGNLWFTLDGTGPSRIGRITPSGTITLFTSQGSGNDGLLLSGISAGPDGNLWFTYEDFSTNANAIGRITTTGTSSLFPTPTPNSGPTDITAGPDGAMWFTEAVGNVGRITTS